MAAPPPLRRLYVNDVQMLDETVCAVEIMSTPDRHSQLVRIENLGHRVATLVAAAQPGSENDPAGNVLTVEPSTKIDVPIALPGVPFTLASPGCQQQSFDSIRISLLDTQVRDNLLLPRVLPTEAYMMFEPPSPEPPSPPPPSSPPPAEESAVTESPEPTVAVVEEKESKIEKDEVPGNGSPAGLQIWVNNIRFTWSGQNFVKKEEEEKKSIAAVAADAPQLAKPSAEESKTAAEEKPPEEKAPTSMILPAPAADPLPLPPPPPEPPVLLRRRERRQHQEMEPIEIHHHPWTMPANTSEPRRAHKRQKFEERYERSSLRRIARASGLVFLMGWFGFFLTHAIRRFTSIEAP